jgi:hypothetical protein
VFWLLTARLTGSSDEFGRILVGALGVIIVGKHTVTYPLAGWLDIVSFVLRRCLHRFQTLGFHE